MPFGDGRPAEFGGRVGEHEHGIADPDSRVHQLATRSGRPVHFGRAERFRQEIDVFGGSVDG